MTWTWIIYLATHNNAADAGAASLDRIRAAPLAGGVRVLAQQATPGGTSRHVFGDGAPRASAIGATDAGDPATLLECVRWAAGAAPAERYALVLWSHGSGWEPSEMQRQAQQARPAPSPVTPGELRERAAGGADGRRVFFSPSLRRLLERPTPAERAIAFDDGSGHSLDAVELGGVARDAAALLGRPLDLLGMNACQMASAEVAYEARGGARVFVASQEDMPVESWPYDDILPRLAAQPAMDAASLGKLIVERYCAFFRAISLPWGKEGLPAGATLSAVSLGRIEGLAQAVAALAAALRANIDLQLAAVWAAHRASRAFQFRLHDIATFCRALAAQPSVAPAVAAAAQAALAAMGDPALVLAQGHTAPAYDGIGGLTTYLNPPTPGRELSPFYAETAYAKATGWGDFLSAYYAAAI